MKFIKLNQVLEKIGIARSTYYRDRHLLNLPQSVKVTGSLEVWLEEDIEQWMQERIDLSRAQL